MGIKTMCICLLPVQMWDKMDLVLKPGDSREYGRFYLFRGAKLHLPDP